MTLTIHPVALLGVAVVVLCLAAVVAVARTQERINAANNASLERTNRETMTHMERMEELRIKAADRFILLRVAEAKRVDTRTAAQMILSGSVEPKLLN